MHGSGNFIVIIITAMIIITVVPAMFVHFIQISRSIQLQATDLLCERSQLPYAFLFPCVFAMCFCLKDFIFR